MSETSIIKPPTVNDVKDFNNWKKIELVIIITFLPIEHV